MRVRKTISVFLAAVLVTVALLNLSVSAEEIKLNRTSLVIPIEYVTQLSVIGYDGVVQWASSNSEVVQVRADGRIKAFKEGTATIAAKCGELILTCKVTVTEYWTWQSPPPPKAPLTQEKLDKLREDFKNQSRASYEELGYVGFFNADIQDETIVRYCGNYNGYDVIVAAAEYYPSDKFQPETEAVIADCRFVYFDSQNYPKVLYRVLVYKDGLFIDIKDAYEQGLISRNDVRRIEYEANFYDKYRDADKWGEPGVSMALPRQLIAQMRSDVRRDFRGETYITASYGTFNGYPVVRISPAAITLAGGYIFVDGYVFHLSHGTVRPWLYKDSQFISIQTAYLLGYLSDKDLYVIYRRHARSRYA
ncbi:MAG: Ig-like domain-containing protein [Oscillospiraceae bacterium]|nr:Ig-like domain-containing protein [Oscillospiraceae bacterium]